MSQEAPPTLIQHARAQLLSTEEQQRLQREADAICGQTYLEAEALFQGSGRVRRNIGLRIYEGFLTGIIIGAPVIAALEAYSFMRYRNHIWEVGDQLELRTSVNGSEPLVSVHIWTIGNETSADIKRAQSIGVSVQGLDNSIELYRNYGNIINPKYLVRKADLQEAQQWNQLITALRNQPRS